MTDTGKRTNEAVRRERVEVKKEETTEKEKLVLVSMVSTVYTINVMEKASLILAGKSRQSNTPLNSNITQMV